MGNSWHRYMFDKNETLLCIVDYYRKFPIMKRADGLSADDLIRASKVMFKNLCFPKNSIRCRHALNVRSFKTVLQAAKHKSDHNLITLLPQQWTGGSMFKFCQMCNQKCFDNNTDVNFVLLQIRSM